MQRKVFCGLIAMLLLALILPPGLHAAVVGRFTLIKGQVDLLKGGKVPGIPAKVQDGVEPGDVIRTKTMSKAQLSMVDASVITLAPESRLAIADYQYNPARDERRAVLRLFQGLVHTAVNRIIKTEEPDFIMETHTATIGVRGTDWYTLLGPNSTGVYLPRGYFGREFQPPHRSGLAPTAFQAIYPGSPGQTTFSAPDPDSGDHENAGATDGHRADQRRVRIWPACLRYGRPISNSLDSAGEPGSEAINANHSPGARASAADSGSGPNDSGSGPIDSGSGSSIPSTVQSTSTVQPGTSTFNRERQRGPFVKASVRQRLALMRRRAETAGRRLRAGWLHPPGVLPAPGAGIPGSGKIYWP